MNLKLKILLFFNYFINFKGCCIYDKNEKYTKINNNNGNENINKNNEDDERPIDDDKDKKPVDPNQDKNITRRPSYFRWNGDCAVQVFAMTFFIIFRDNPEGLKLLEDSNILFFQKIAKICKDYYYFKKTGIKKSNTTEELHEVYKEFGRFLVNESLKIVNKMLKFIDDNNLYLGILKQIEDVYGIDSEVSKFDKVYIEKYEAYNNIYEEYYFYASIINFFCKNLKYNNIESYNLNIDYNLRFEDIFSDIEDFYERKSFLNYYKNVYSKFILEKINKLNDYGFGFSVEEIFSLLKKHITNIENNEKFKNLYYDNDNKNINENTIFIKSSCCLGANLDISKKKESDHCNCIYKDIDGKWRYAYGYNEEFLIDENLIKQKKFKEIVENYHGSVHYTFYSVDGFINIKI